VARTCSTSEVPIPKARAPNAPWADCQCGFKWNWEGHTGSVRITTDDGCSGKSETLLRTDDVDDTWDELHTWQKGYVLTLSLVVHTKVGQAKLLDIVL
jgi:hypothetical protein